MRGNVVVLVILCMIAPGCFDSGKPDALPLSPGLDSPLTVLVATAEACGSCGEPTAAWDDRGRLFVVSGAFVPPDGTGGFRVSEDGGNTFSPLTPPPAIASPASLLGLARGDVQLQVDPHGRLWWTALQLESTRPASVQVARSDDGGLTWVVNQRVTSLVQGYVSSADRNWMAFGDDGVAWLVCTCPAGGVAQVFETTDGGATFSEGRPITTALVRPGPVGFPAFGGGALVVPHLVGVQNVGSATGTHGVSVAVSRDGGRSFESAVLQAPAAEGTYGARFPVAAWQDGAFAVTWNRLPGESVVSFSHDGGRTWTDPSVWSGSLGAIAPHPWISPLGHDRWGVMHYARNGTAVDVMLAVGPEGAPDDILRLGTTDDPVTDLPHFAVSRAGDLAAVWRNAEGLQVSIIKSAPASLR